MANLHLMGIGGVGMAGLAVLLRARGAAVSGCDLHPSPRTRWLETHGISVSFGHDPVHLTGADDLIVTPAVAVDEPERIEAAVRGLRVRCRGEVLADLVNSSDGIAVCGSHGKTTTATWIARLLLALGEDIAWCIGGETGDFPVAGCGRTSATLVVEADESDGTLALYRAKTLVVNRCEYDHPDHFRTEAEYFACYEKAKRQAGTVIESEALPEIDGFGFLDTLPDHNRKNARAAVEVALRRGHSASAIAAALPSIVAKLPDRRFQTVWESPRVVTDYAHHPTEMACAIGMARQACAGTLRVLFQPHRYSRTKALIADFPPALSGADEVFLCPTYAAFEQPVDGGAVTDLYAACRAAFAADPHAPRRLVLADSCEAAWSESFRAMRPGDLTLLLGAGDIIGLVPRVRQDLGSQIGRTKGGRG